ncbi:MAG: SMI1/KNR4 family protein [Cytophagales bacterium]|nr:SMI1/KNR4 family protein [Cytophagales bacterium]
MNKIDKKQPPKKKEIEIFLKQIDFDLPEGFISFFQQTNGADIEGEKTYVIFWPLTDMILLNKEYKVEEFAPNFFVFGSNGGGTAFAIEKVTGHICELPFIGISQGEAVHRCETFNEFIESI